MIKKTGFSLIELIVVMTIIMVVTMVGLVSFSGANKKARDSRRQADLEKIRIALEVYRQQLGSYPNVNGVPSSVLALLAPNYMSTVPDDPLTTLRQYYYLVGATPYSYSLFAAMEDPSSASSGSPFSSGDCEVNNAGVINCTYKVVSP